MITFPRILIAVLVVWVATPVVAYFALGDWQTRGQAGDVFGAVNALFSGLAFAAVYWALRLQGDQLKLQSDQLQLARDELKLQREELKLQREEMIASRQELANQVEAQKALCRATTAQIVIAAQEAHIEAIKMDSERYPTHRHEQHIDEIKAIANKLSDLARDVTAHNEGRTAS